MPVPSELLAQLAQLEGPIADVRNAVQESREPHPGRRVRDAVRIVELAVHAWLESSGQIESDLIEHGRLHPNDLADVQARIGGLEMLHLSAAADVATLQPLDEISEGSLVSEVKLEPDYSSTLQDVAFDEGRILDAISHQFDEPDEVAGASSDDRDLDLIDEVVKDIIGRGGAAGTAVLIGLAGGSGAVFASVAPHLTTAIGVAPDTVRSALVAATRRISRLVLALVTRATEVLTEVLGGYREAVGSMVEAADPTSLVTESLADRVLGRIVSADTVRKRAKGELAKGTDVRSRYRRLRQLKVSNSRWVGPVRIVAKGLPKLWAVPIGPVPSAPVAAVALLGWTLLITGDQLDAQGFPNIWKGVVRRAAGG